MKSSINLLPRDIKQTASSNSKVKLLNVATISILVITLIVVIVGSGLVFIEQRKVSEMELVRNQLRTEVESHFITEQQLIFVKDRVSEIEKLRSQNVYQGTFQKQQYLFELMPEGVTFSRQIIGDGENVYTFRATSASNLKNYIDMVSVDPTFDSVVLNQLTYSPAFGYQAEVLIQ